MFVLDVPFAMRAVASAAGARWSADAGAFLFEGEHVPPALEPFRAQPYSWERHVERELRGETLSASKPRASITLRAHQVEATAAIAAAIRADRAGFLLADDVGLGKTLTAWQAILNMPAARVLIVAPLSVLAHWRRTIEAMGDGGKDIVLLNYERLGKLFELSAAARKKVKSKKGLARAGTAPELDVIVWDESHKCKNPTAARSKLAAKLNAQAGFVLWLSATAGQNPLELSYLAPLLANLTGAKKKELADFEAWCDAEGLGVQRGNFGKWEWRGDPQDCEKIHALLFQPRGAQPPAGLRRRPEELVGWPALNRILAPLELGAEARALYREAWTEFRAALDLEPHGKNPKSGLAASLRLRQKSSLLRAPGTAELVAELCESGHRVAVSVAFHETLQWLEEELRSRKLRTTGLHGKTAASEREAARESFQRGEVDVILFTVEEGISLHQGELLADDAPRALVVHDLRWSAIQMAQIEGRCHRDGRFAPAYWVYADDTVEEKIARIVAGRIQSMKAMVGDDTETLREIEDALRERSA